MGFEHQIDILRMYLRSILDNWYKTLVFSVLVSNKYEFIIFFTFKITATEALKVMSIPIEKHKIYYTVTTAVFLLTDFILIEIFMAVLLS